MSSLAEKMYMACLEPVFTADEQVISVTKCNASGTILVDDTVEPQVVPIPKVMADPRGVVDTESISPGEQPTGNIKPPVESGNPEGAEPVKEEKGVMTWVKENPVIAIAGAAALVLLLTSKRN